MKNKNFVVMMIMLIGVVAITGISFAYFTSSMGSGVTLVSVVTGSLDIDFVETSVINVDDIEPIYDADRASSADKSVFTISHNDTSNLAACYEVNLIVDSIQDKFKSEYIKYELVDTSTGTSITGIQNFSTLGTTPVTLLLDDNIDLSLTDSHSYELRIWLSYSDTVDQTSLLTNNSGTAISAHIEATAINGTCN